MRPEQARASIMAGSISIVSTRSSRGSPSRVWVVSPEPNPMTAAVLGFGWCALETTPAITIVISSGPGLPSAAMRMPASTLPLVAIERTAFADCRTATLAVFPSR